MATKVKNQEDDLESGSTTAEDNRSEHVAESNGNMDFFKTLARGTHYGIRFYY